MVANKPGKTDVDQLQISRGPTCKDVVLVVIQDMYEKP